MISTSVQMTTHILLYCWLVWPVAINVWLFIWDLCNVNDIPNENDKRDIDNDDNDENDDNVDNDDHDQWTIKKNNSHTERTESNRMNERVYGEKARIKKFIV